jgi:hypothetical protein
MAVGAFLGKMTSYVDNAAPSAGSRSFQKHGKTFGGLVRPAWMGPPTASLDGCNGDEAAPPE